jgi:hypothetical protein
MLEPIVHTQFDKKIAKHQSCVQTLEDPDAPAVGSRFIASVTFQSRSELLFEEAGGLLISTWLREPGWYPTGQGGQKHQGAVAQGPSLASIDRIFFVQQDTKFVDFPIEPSTNGTIWCDEGLKLGIGNLALRVGVFRDLPQCDVGLVEYMRPVRG